MKELKPIEQREILGKVFRIYGDFENPLFLAKDVAEWIEHSNSRMMLDTIDENEKIKKLHPVNNPYGGYQEEEQWFLTEDGLYEVFMQSRKPIAKQFKAKVKEILKDIRKYGLYANTETLDNFINDPDTLITVLTRYKEVKQQKEQLEVTNKQQEQIISELKPIADYANRILQSSETMNITAIAKDYGMSGTSMNKKLHKLKIQYLQDDQWLLYEKYQNEGYTHSNTITIKRKDGTYKTRLHTKWTQKGRLFLYELLKRDGTLPMIERRTGAVQISYKNSIIKEHE